MPITVETIYRYPVKGLRAEPLDTVSLAPGHGVPHDRRFGIARGDTKLDPAAPRWLPKQRFVMLMRDAALAPLSCRFDEDSETLELKAPDVPSTAASWRDARDRELLNAYVNDFLGARREGPARLVESGRVSFTDVPQNCLSIINLESVRDLEERMRTALGPMRFRANLYLAGAPAWTEFDWVGREIRIGEAVLHVPSRIPRCAATAVDPDGGRRDANVIRGLRDAFGHYDMGVYAEVVRGGTLQRGDELFPPDDARPRSWLGHWMRFFGFLARAAPIVLGRR